MGDSGDAWALGPDTLNILSLRRGKRETRIAAPQGGCPSFDLRLFTD